MKLSVLNLLLTLVLCDCASGLGATNIVTRVIRYEKPAVFVLDQLRLNDRSAGLIATYPLAEMFDAAAKGETDPTRFIRDFLKGDDVEVQNCRMAYEHGCIDLMIKSKVRFVAHKPSRLRIVGTFVGVLYMVGKTPTSEESEEMLIFEDAGGTLLWFPDFGVPDDLPSALIARLGCERLQPKDFRLTSTLEVGGKTETLLDLDWSQITSNAPSAAFLTELQQVHPMSGNDLLRLFSTLKLAKGGYYNIYASGFTNVFPGPALSLKNVAIKQKELKPTKFQLDGSFDDWKDYKSGWTGGITNTPFKVISGSPMDTQGAVDITECDYCNDQKYLYMFLKFKPSLESRHKGPHPTGHVGVLYLGTQKDKLVPGTEVAEADFQVSIPYGSYSSTFDGKDSEGSCVSYRIRKRDVNATEFSTEIRVETSTDEQGLIRHGKDGVELAIRLSDLRKKSGDRLVVTCIDDGIPVGHKHMFPIVIE